MNRERAEVLDPLWVCACGQVYRMARNAQELRFWPSTGTAAYSRHGLGANCPCIRCGERIRGKTPSRLPAARSDLARVGAR